MRTAGLIVAGATVAVSASSASAINIVLDYSHDSFFAGNATAKAALEAAAQDISDVIVTSLGATTDTSVGTFGSTTVTLDFGYSYENPSTGANINVSNAVLPADEVRIFVGTRNLTSNTLGQGGPGGIAFSAGASGFPSELPQAVDAAEAAGNANMGRGGGPIIGTLTGDFGSSSTDFSIGFGSSLGNLWFDSDSDNNGVTDAGTLDSSYWHFDHTTPVAAGKNDLYSVALHEILHALGIGGSESWNSLVSGTNWTGSHVIDLLGSGANLIDDDGSHIAENVLGTRLSDGQSQEVVMDPNIAIGTRKTLTDVDLAFLADIGWDVVPEPASLALLSMGIAAVVARRRHAA